MVILIIYLVHIAFINKNLRRYIVPVLQHIQSFKENNLKRISNDGGNSLRTKSVSSNDSEISSTSSEVGLQSSGKAIPSNLANAKSISPANENVKINIFDKSITKKNQTKLFDKHEKKRAQDKLKGLYTNIVQTSSRCK